MFFKVKINKLASVLSRVMEDHKEVVLCVLSGTGYSVHECVGGMMDGVAANTSILWEGSDSCMKRRRMSSTLGK